MNVRVISVWKVEGLSIAANTMEDAIRIFRELINSNPSHILADGAIYYDKDELNQLEAT